MGMLDSFKFRYILELASLVARESLEQWYSSRIPCAGKIMQLAYGTEELVFIFHFIFLPKHRDTFWLRTNVLNLLIIKVF